MKVHTSILVVLGALSGLTSGASNADIIEGASPVR